MLELCESSVVNTLPYLLHYLRMACIRTWPVAETLKDEIIGDYRSLLRGMGMHLKKAELDPLDLMRMREQ
jgi:hypothetical protein